MWVTKVVRGVTNLKLKRTVECRHFQLGVATESLQLKKYPTHTGSQMREPFFHRR